MDQLNAEKALEQSIADDMAARGLARNRATVLLYDVVGIAPVRRDKLEYFVDKIFVGREALTIASWFFDHGEEVTTRTSSKQRKRGSADPLTGVQRFPLRWS
ncbi:hypothetical protein [Dermabacter hominis]|uniref:hypothetical protein n=1 Tax=Dermabacter hominis TaxID=36740 RepID=UPI00223BE296|nr:hypothetical protein [Dermabacter hominis]MCT2025418.1 hypothetical protein [Dermabacter hominis]